MIKDERDFIQDRMLLIYSIFFGSNGFKKNTVTAINNHPKPNDCYPPILLLLRSNSISNARICFLIHK